MARSYTLRNQVDNNGLALVNVWCRAFNADSGTLVETQYTDSTGSCTFEELPDDDNVNVCVVWGTNVKWFYNIFSAGQDILYNSLTVDHIDATSITLGVLTGDLDDIDDGSSYGKLLLTDISSGHIQLTSNASFSGKWYSSSGVSIDASSGINIWGTSNALTTRATEAGTIQCYVGSDGKLYAGAGAVWLDSTGITLKSSSDVSYLNVKDNNNYLVGKIYGYSSNLIINGNSYAITIGSTGNYVYLGNAQLSSWTRLGNKTSDPSSPLAGCIYYDSVNNLVKIYNGSVWKTVTWS
jgi:hypothetical protein